MKQDRRAVIVGGSIAGMLAARILAERFERVVLIERDRFPVSPEARPGVPQSHHLHVLLLGGLLIFEELFPGFRSELIEAGAPEIDSALDLAWLTPAGWAPRFRSGLSKLAFSRPLLDWLVRRRITALPNIEILEGAETVGLAGDKTLISGVRVSSPDGPHTIAADLVVDASGRGSHVPRWLSRLGCDTPKETVVTARMGYASRVFTSNLMAADWKAVFIQAAPPEDHRAGVLFPLEGGRWLCSLAGAEKDYPPANEAGFLEFAQGLRSRIICDFIRKATPVSRIHTYRAMESRLRHFDRVKLPSGLIAIGDSVCAFNPVYGQGMTVAALSAIALRSCLSGNLDTLPQRFHRRLGRVVAAPWMLATSEDLRYRGVEGAQMNPATRLMHWYVDHVIALSLRDPGVRRRWLEVFHMLRPPVGLFRPDILLKAVATRGRRTGATGGLQPTLS